MKEEKRRGGERGEEGKEQRREANTADEIFLHISK